MTTQAPPAGPVEQAAPVAAEPRPSPVERTTTWVLPVVLLAGLVAAVVGTTSEGDADPLRGLFPHEPGTTWVYAITTDGEPTGFARQQVVGSALLGEDNGDVVETRWDDFLGRGPFRSRQYVVVDGARVLEYGNRQNGEFLAADPPLPVLDAQADEPVTWSGTRGEEEATYTSTVVGVEDVEVAGRDYEDCQRTRAVLEVTAPQPSTDVYEAWTCPGTGTVRSTESYETEGFAVEIGRELVAMTSPALSFRTDRAPDPSAEAAASRDEAGGSADLGPARANAVGGRLEPDAPAWTDVRIDEPAFSPVSAGGLLVVADQNGVLSATDPATGEVAWRVQLSPPLVAPPTAAGDVLLVADARKSLQALDVRTGAARWAAALPDVVSNAPAPAGDVVAVPVDDATLRGFDLATGEPRWTVDLASRTERPVATDGELLFVGEVEGELRAVRGTDGDTVWSQELDGALETGPAVVDDVVVVGDDGGYLRALDVATGDARWEEYSDHSVTEQAAATDGGLALVLDDEHVQVRDLADGRVRWQDEVPAGVEVPPVVVGDELVVLDRSGRLHVRSLADGARRTTAALGGPGAESTVGMGVVGDALVVPVERAANEHALIGLPTAPTGAGLDLTRTVVRLPATPVLPPSGTPEDFAFSAPGGDIWRVRGGVPTRVAEGSFSPFAIPAGDLVLHAADGLLRAVDRSGAQAWVVPMGEVVPSSAPVLDGSTVYVPVRGVGLGAFDAATGAARWLTERPQGGTGSTTPLVLPDGDVVYGQGELARFDARTGAVRWSVPGLELFAPVAADQDTVYAAGYQSEVGVLVAVDARTGELRWAQPVDPDALQGPVVSDGRVALVDAGRVLRAHDAATGAPAWSLPLQTPAGGPLVVLGDALAVVEAGSTEDLDPEDHRAVLLAARDGRLLASYEARGNDYGAGAATRLGDGLLMPSFDQGIVGELLAPVTR